MALLDRVCREVALLVELPVLRRRVVLVVRDRVLGRVAVRVEADLPEYGVVGVGRVRDVGANGLTELGHVASGAGADGLEGREEDLRAGVARSTVGAGLRVELG